MEHKGTVTALRPGFATVQIESTSACAGCAAHSKCGFAESKNKTLDIPTDASSNTFNIGDTVTVHIDSDRGLLATWWAYILPALLLLAVAVSLSLLHLPEPLVILLSLAALAVYTLILYLVRHKLNNKFSLSLTPSKSKLKTLGN